MQPGGQTKARHYLTTFGKERGANYTRFISKPQEPRALQSSVSYFMGQLAYVGLSPQAPSKL